jgi:hypothetical protein
LCAAETHRHADLSTLLGAILDAAHQPEAPSQSISATLNGALRPDAPTVVA